MSDTYRVSVIGRTDLDFRELIFAMPPRVGESVRLPDKDGDLRLCVRQVVHSARLPHSSRIAETHIILIEED